MSARCRGCLAGAGAALRSAGARGLAHHYTSITTVKIDPTDGVPDLLCQECEAKLLECVRFRLRCQKSYIYLKAQLDKKPVSTQRIVPPATQERLEKSIIRYDFTNEKLILRITPHDLDIKEDGQLNCPLECKSVFKKTGNLISHLVNEHGVDQTKFTLEMQYYCPHMSCPYEINSEKNKYFPFKKTLKNHVRNVHKEKCFACETCRDKFATETELNRHKLVCRLSFLCTVCDIEYKSNERLLVHLMRKHPDLHKEYKQQNKQTKQLSKANNKRRTETSHDAKKLKTQNDEVKSIETQTLQNEDFLFDSSPKRTFATQTFDLKPLECIKNDITLSSCVAHSPQYTSKSDDYLEERASSTTIETQTVFEDLLSIRSQNSEDEIFESVSLSDIQTQTWPLEFDSSPLKKIKNTSETQTNPFLNENFRRSPDLSFKETQTCFCYLDSPKPNASHFNFPRSLFDSATSSPVSCVVTTETQTGDAESFARTKKDVMLSINSIETQTNAECLDDEKIM